MALLETHKRQIYERTHRLLLKPFRLLYSAKLSVAAVRPEFFFKKMLLRLSDSLYQYTIQKLSPSLHKFWLAGFEEYRIDSRSQQMLNRSQHKQCLWRLPSTWYSEAHLWISYSDRRTGSSCFSKKFALLLREPLVLRIAEKLKERFIFSVRWWHCWVRLKTLRRINYSNAQERDSRKHSSSLTFLRFQSLLPTLYPFFALLNHVRGTVIANDTYRGTHLHEREESQWSQLDFKYRECQLCKKE